MSHDSTSPDMGQSSTTPADPTLIDVMERNIKALVRMSAALVRLSGRLDRIEGRRTQFDDEPVTEREPESEEEIPPLALRSDGAFLLHISEVDGLNLDKRERWEGVVLSDAEASDVLVHLADGVADAAGRVGGWILRAAKRSKEGEEGGES